MNTHTRALLLRRFGPFLMIAAMGLAIAGCDPEPTDPDAIDNAITVTATLTPDNGQLVIPKVTATAKSWLVIWRDNGSGAPLMSGIIAKLQLPVGVPQHPRPCGDAGGPRPLHDPSLRLGRAHRRLHHGRHRPLAIAVQGGLVSPLVGRIGERMTLIVGLLFGCAGFFAWGLASDGAWFLAGLPIFALWGLATPTTQALMSHLVPMTEQGKLQGANASIKGVGSMTGPLLFSQVFAYFIDPARGTEYPGAPMILAGLVLAAAAVAAWTATRQN